MLKRFGLSLMGLLSVGFSGSLNLFHYRDRPGVLSSRFPPFPLYISGSLV